MNLATASSQDCQESMAQDGHATAEHVGEKYELSLYQGCSAGKADVCSSAPAQLRQQQLLAPPLLGVAAPKALLAHLAAEGGCLGVAAS
jgi:hypothetical protein